MSVTELAALRDALLSAATHCKRCRGTGLITLSYGGDGYGGRCAARADADDQICPDCCELREALE